jgi:hypothetical protein
MTKEEAVSLVQKFLRFMEDRDLESANAMLAPGARITFPGNRVFGSQAEMVAASRGRYQWVKKTFDQVDVLTEEETFVVYIMGTLYGVNHYSVEFSGIRYVDRFVIRDGLITQQDVWNDLTESGVLDQNN